MKEAVLTVFFNNGQKEAFRFNIYEEFSFLDLKNNIEQTRLHPGSSFGISSDNRHVMITHEYLKGAAIDLTIAE